MENAINSFEDATKMVAKYYIAGIDSAVRHSRKGDARSYFEKASRTESWKRGYTFALNCIEDYGIENLHGYGKDSLGDSCHDAQCFFLRMFPIEVKYPHLTGIDTTEHASEKLEHEPSAPSEEVRETESEKPKPVDETSACYWYAEEVEGSRLAGKGKHAGMWYVSKVA